MQEPERRLSAGEGGLDPPSPRRFPHDQTPSSPPPEVAGRRSPTHPRPLRINIAPELIQFRAQQRNFYTNMKSFLSGERGNGRGA